MENSNNLKIGSPVWVTFNDVFGVHAAYVIGIKINEEIEIELIAGPIKFRERKTISIKQIRKRIVK